LASLLLLLSDVRQAQTLWGDYRRFFDPGKLLERDKIRSRVVKIASIFSGVKENLLGP
jgi:hypothetical protein